MKLAVVLFNLGGPDCPDAIEPFLRNLFSDPAIITLPGMIRIPLARWIASRRAPVAREIYAKIGGRSPILEETQAQAAALEAALQAQGHETRVFIAMRCWKPFSDETAAAVARWKPERTILLPLYPQYSTTTAASSLAAWNDAANGLVGPQSRVCCYPAEEGFVESVARLISDAMNRRKPDVAYRVLFSAHGLPKRLIARGDPYQWQVEQTAAAIVARLTLDDWAICYQSRVGPLEWIGPMTDAEIRRAGVEGKGVIVAPIAFVSEHSETLVELDLEYRHLASQCGVADYIRVPTVGVSEAFIAGLARLAIASIHSEHTVTDCGGRRCPAGFRGCGFMGVRQ